MNEYNKMPFHSFSFSYIVPGYSAPKARSVDETIALYDSFDKVLEVAESFPLAEEMLAAIGIK